MKKNIFTKLIILKFLLLFSCNFTPNREDFVFISKKLIDIPNDFNTTPKVCDITAGNKSLIIPLTNLDNKIVELKITNTAKEDYNFKIEASEKDIDKKYYLNILFSIKDAGPNSNIQIDLTFNKNNDDYNTTIFSVLKTNKLLVREIYKGWYSLKKTKNSKGHYVPVLLKL